MRVCHRCSDGRHRRAHWFGRRRQLVGIDDARRRTSAAQEHGGECAQSRESTHGSCPPPCRVHDCMYFSHSLWRPSARRVRRSHRVTCTRTMRTRPCPGICRSPTRRVCRRTFAPRRPCRPAPPPATPVRPTRPNPVITRRVAPHFCTYTGKSLSKTESAPCVLPVTLEYCSWSHRS